MGTVKLLLVLFALVRIRACKPNSHLANNSRHPIRAAHIQLGAAQRLEMVASDIANDYAKNPSTTANPRCFTQQILGLANDANRGNAPTFVDVFGVSDGVVEAGSVVCSLASVL
jgi:hypothetical protein